MKKIFTFLLLLSSIQFVNAQFKFSVLAGINKSKFPVTPENVGHQSFNFRTGYHLGGNVEFGTGIISIQSGLTFTVKGGNNTYSYNNLSPGQFNYAIEHDVFHYTFNNLQLPVNVIFHINCGPGSFVFGGGFYGAYGLSGTEKTDYDNTTSDGRQVKGTGSVNGFQGSGSYNRMDYGLNSTAGYKLKKIILSAGYAYGLTNIDRLGGYYTSKNRCLSISVGYYL